MISCGNSSTAPASGSRSRLQRDVEAGLLGARAVIGEVEAFLDQRIDIGRPVLAGALARMQQHVLDDGVGALAVLHDLFEIVLQQSGHFIDFLALLVGERGRPQHVVQFVGQLGRKRREIIDEIERVLDLVGDAGGELAERGQLFGLHQAILRGAEVFERLRQAPSCGACTSFEQPDIRDRDHRLVGEGLRRPRSGWR